ncbi:hypothetical protein FRX31_008842, partial [Thalictrum thalictroides]
VRANPAVGLTSPSVRFDELRLSNVGNVNKTVISELEEVRSERDEDELSVDSDVELASSVPCDDDDIQDEAGHSCTPEDGEDNEASVSGRISESVMRLIRKGRRSFPEIRRRYQIVERRIEMSLVDKTIPEVDDNHSILLLEGQLKAGARLPLSKFVCDVLNHYEKAPISMASRFWHAMRIMAELRSMFHYNIEVADVVSFFLVKPCRVMTGIFS